MKTHTLPALLIALLIPAAFTASADDKAEQIAVIVNRSSALTDLSSAELVKYFKVQKTKISDGSKLTLVAQDVGRPERNAVLSKVYAMSEDEYSRYFLQATFTGAVAAAPKALPNGGAVIKFVEETPGAISYVRASEATEAVKVVKIDGKAPGDAGYPLVMK